MDEFSIPCCLQDDEPIEAMKTLADRIAANCSATNGQVMDALIAVSCIFIDEYKRNNDIDTERLLGKMHHMYLRMKEAE